MDRSWRPAAVLALSALAVGAGPGAAAAGTASGRPAGFTAGAGERNDLTVDGGPGGSVRFADTGAPVLPGLWCAPFPPGEALCDPDGDPRDTDGGGVGVALGDGDDRAVVRRIPGTDTRPGTIRVTGGPGDDRLESSASGVIRFDGGDGDDTLVTAPGAGALLLGGPGADRMVSTAVCCAVASYADHGRGGVRVKLDATANDGAPGEGDDVRTSGVLGSPGPDVITGAAAADALTGSGGADVLDAGAGDDVVDATLQAAPPGAGSDGPDTVTCGPGTDGVAADADDTVAVDCERVLIGLPGGPELVLDTAAARAGPKGSVALTYRVRFPNPDDASTSRSTLRLVDGQGRAASTTAQFVLGRGADVARPRVTLTRATRRRLARSRSGALVLIAQRVSRDGDAGSDLSNVPVTIRRRARR
jgi:hypothetical protein